jgi:diacylglycerol kinase
MSDRNQSSDSDQKPGRKSWLNKFIDAASGVSTAFQTESSFYIHLPVGIMVIIAAVLLRVTVAEICILFFCITMVITSELFNTAIEWLAKSITDEHDEHIQKALDISSGAVLVASFLSAMIGLAIFGSHIVRRFFIE